MRLASLIILWVAGASAYKLGFSQKSDDVLQTTIPGGSPVDTCQSPAPEDDLIEITHLELFPNPPEKGKNLTITATGIVKEDIEVGAYALIRVKYGLITLIRMQIDLCEQTDKIDLSCPIRSGKITLERDIELPNAIPPGKYQAQADVYTEDGRPVTCLVANVKYDEL